MTVLTLSIILLTMATHPAPAVREMRGAPQLAQEPRVARALEWFDHNTAWVTEQHIRITEIPAPPFEEAARAQAVRKMLEPYGLKLRIDEVGNVIGERAGTDRGVVLIAAHLDTVFPAGTDVTVKRDGKRLLAPGISDNSAGVASLVAVARAMHEAKLRTNLTVIFAANVGEEGEGNLRGIRKLVETYRSRLRYVIALDGATTDHVVNRALASRRVEITVTGPGGHSWSDFGTPNPIHALSRGVAQFIKVRIPEDPRTAFNVGQVLGGTSVNSIPDHASIKVDLRSESETELDRLENVLRDSIQQGVDEEEAASRNRRNGNGGRLDAKFRVMGVRPGGDLAADSPLLTAIREADRLLGNRSRLERSSTDANIPLSLGIPAIAIGSGGLGGGAHSLAEWFEPEKREMGLKRILLTVLGVAGTVNDRNSGE